MKLVEITSVSPLYAGKLPVTAAGRSTVRTGRSHGRKKNDAARKHGRWTLTRSCAAGLYLVYVADSHRIRWPAG
jgi:hypothetical protein